MVDDAVIESILNDYSKFTKEEYEIINTYVVKKEAEQEIKRAERIANTDPQFLVRRKYLDKYGDIALKHKELILNNYIEHLNAHKEILLQLYAILQSLVQNPNVLDTLADILSSEWYGGSDFKKFIAEKIQEEHNLITTLWNDILILVNMPLLYFVPELFDNTPYDIKSFNTDISTHLNEMFRNNYPLLP